MKDFVAIAAKQKSVEDIVGSIIILVVIGMSFLAGGLVGYMVGHYAGR